MLEPDPANHLAARCEQLSVDYRSAAGTVRALHGVDAQFAAGQITVVAGPSGSGKSTLLRTLTGLQRPAAGTVEVAGHDLGALSRRRLRRLRRRRMGIVLQSPAANLIEYLPAIEQVTLAARLRGVATSEAPHLLDAVGLTERASSYPHELSGGEQQRVAFSAAAIGRPALLLADEPTAQLDTATSTPLIAALRQLADRDVTLVVSSHDPAVIAVADTVIRLRDGEVATT